MITSLPILKVLHIEDNPVDAIYVKEILAEAGARWELQHVRRLADGLRLLSEKAFDGLLLDLDLIDSRGLETVDTVRRVFPSIPIVVLSGFQDETFGFRSLEKGSQDYLVKGQIDGAMLIRSMRYAIERKRTEAALQESEARLKSMFRDAAIGMAVVSLEGEFLQVNPAFCEFAGYAEKELTGKRVRDVLFAEDWEETESRMEKLRAGSPLEHFEKRYKHRAGGAVWSETRAVLVRDGEGKPSYVVTQMVDVTARKKAEEALRQSEARFRTLTERSADLVLIVSGRGEIQYKSLNVEHVLGFQPAAGGENITELVHPEDRAELQLLLMEGVQQPGAIRKGEVRLRHRSGAWRVMDAVARNLLGDPSIRGVVLNLRDITERKEAEQALRESEARFRVLVQRAPEAILVHDVDTDRFVDANFNAERLFGCSAEELLRWGPKKFYVPEQPDGRPVEESMHDNMARALAGQEVVFERQIHSGDGRDVHCEVRLVRLPSSRQKLLRASFIDITARKKDEEAIRESEERYRRLFESSLDGIAYTDLSGRILSANPAYVAMLGYTPEETLAMTYQSMTPGPWRARDAAIMRDEVLARGFCNEYEKEYIRKDGTVFPVAVRAWLMRDARGRPAATWRIIRDISERKRMEEALKKGAGELARSNRDLEEFARIISHDLQEPLRMVTGFLQLLQMQNKEKLDGKSNEYIGFAVDGATRMKALITGLLDYSRAGGRELVLQPAELQGLLDTALANLEPRIRKSGAVITHDPMPERNVDAGQISQIFQNLLCNALKFTKEPPRIHVGAARRANEWTISVRDNGIGIDPKSQGRLFEVFQKLHDREEYEGTGIGLAICKKIVQRHGGRIWVESAPGRGSTFYFSLPDAPAAGPVEEAVKTPAAATAGRG
jgi:PAS domain S-box-containing protein